MSQSSSGPSPLARGTRADSMPFIKACRSIPARAGNTRTPSTRTSSPTVHPRSRGEHTARRALAQPDPGPSPLARGTRQTCQRIAGHFRSIPARAGNTTPPAFQRAQWRVHPRSRGEHAGVTPSRIGPEGPSPLARGTHVEHAPLLVQTRSIPARAGNTPSPCLRPARNWVHPRSRGEHGVSYAFTFRIDGPSPLARGTPRCRWRCKPTRRSIPARAGNTLATIDNIQPMEVHPRSRGEHSSPRRCLRSGVGPSPLARGTLFHQPHCNQ